MQNFDLYKFGFDNFRSSNGCNFAFQKIKIVQRTHVLQCSENHDIHFRCAISTGSMGLFLGNLISDTLPIKFMFK